MDELKISLSNGLMTGMVTKLLTKLISKKLGYKIDIQLNDLKINVVDSKAHVHVNVDAEMNNDDFMNLIKSMNKD
jgi:hypothetical protein